MTDFVVNGELDLTEFNGLLSAYLTTNLSRFGHGPRDVSIWWVVSDGMFSFSSAKSLLHTSLTPDLDMMLGRCWHNHFPFMMSFLAWRVLRRRLLVADTLARFGFHGVSYLVVHEPGT